MTNGLRRLELLGLIVVTSFAFHVQARAQQSTWPQQLQFTVCQGQNCATISRTDDHTDANHTSATGLDGYRPNGYDGTFHPAWGSTVSFRATILDGTVPSGYRVRIYHSDWPNVERCGADNGRECSGDWKLGTQAENFPQNRTVCAELMRPNDSTAPGGYGIRPVCVYLNMVDAPASTKAWPEQLQFRVCQGDRCATISRTDDHTDANHTSANGLDDYRPNGYDGTFHPAWGSTVNFRVTLMDGTVPSGYRVRVYHSDWPYIERCHADTGRECTGDWKLGTQAENFPQNRIVCAELMRPNDSTAPGGYGIRPVCVYLNMR